MRFALFFIILFSVFTVSFCQCGTFIAANGTSYNLNYLTRTQDYTVVGNYQGNVKQYVFNFCQVISPFVFLAIQVDVGDTPPYDALLIDAGTLPLGATQLSDGRISQMYVFGDTQYECTPRTFEIRIASIESWPCGTYNVSFDAAASASCSYVVDFLTNLKCTEAPTTLYSSTSTLPPGSPGSEMCLPPCIPISLPSQETFIIFMVLYGFFIITALLLFCLRRRQVKKKIREHQKLKTSPTDLSSLPSKARDTISSLSKGEIIWADVSHPVPTPAGPVFAIVLSLFGIAIVCVTTQLSVIVFRSVFYIVFIILVLPGFFYTLIMLIKLLKSYNYDAFNVLTDTSAVVQYRSLFKNTTKEWYYENLKRENIKVSDSYVISGVGSLEFAFEFKDVTHEYKNNAAAYRHTKPVVHLSNKVSLDTMVDMPIENDISQNGKIYRKTAVGFQNIINAYDTEKMLLDRVR